MSVFARLVIVKMMIKMKNRSHGHDKNSPAVTGKIYGTDSSFHGIAHNTKSLISIFQEFSSSINKAFILAGGLDTRLSFYEV